ncbi:hypothetical protein BX616_002282 [Lobosporangium transversale]|nr:hypothetical protein BX616_002282 [Lobosporangium transversale]
MNEQNNTTADNHNIHGPNFVRKIVDKVTGKHHQGHSDKEHHGDGTPKHHQQQHNTHHQYGSPVNRHDNAYVGEAEIVGAHAIPPMTTHADPTYRNEQQRQKAHVQAQKQTQALSNPSAQQPATTNVVLPFQGDPTVGHNYHAAENERQ